MALSPWLGSVWLESRSAAALLVGMRPDEITSGHAENLSPDFEGWWQNIKGAIALGELPARIEMLPSARAAIPDGWPKTYAEWEAMDWNGWSSEDQDACLDMFLGPSPFGVSLDSPYKAWIEKANLHAWLLKRGIADESIPEEIRTYPREDAEDEAEDQHNELARVYEDFGLLVQTFVQKQGLKYQRAGRPNCKQIAQAMSQEAGQLAGMGESKLARRLGKALKAWEDRRR